jgi:hypothetical protein
MSEVAHIYPYSMLNPSSARPPEFDFWDTLKRFWSDDRIQKWRNAIFPDQNSPDKGVETCSNLMCLSRDAHGCWAKGYFALKPIQLSDDKKCLEVEFHWMPQYRYSSNVDILTPPKSSEGLDGRPDIMLFHIPTKRPICSGDKISLKTDDPEMLPLPHFALLEMQWILQRVAAMSAAAEIYDDFDNDDDDAMALRNEWDPCGEDEWDSDIEDETWNSYEESPPMKAGQISPPTSPLCPPSPSPLPKSNIRSDYILPRPAENPGIKMISSSQG